MTDDGAVFQTHKAFDAVVDSLLRLLDKDVIDYVRHCNQYFRLLKAYLQLVSPSVKVLLAAGESLCKGPTCSW